MMILLSLFFFIFLGVWSRNSVFSQIIPQERETFTIVVLPDTQYYSSYYEETFQEQTFWSCQCSRYSPDGINVKFVSHLGDIVHRGNKNPRDWSNAGNAMKNLLNCNLPHGILPGNHDFKNPQGGNGNGNGNMTISTQKEGAGTDPYLYFHKTFPINNYRDFPWFGGTSNGMYMNNNYQLFEVPGFGRSRSSSSFIFIHLEYLFSSTVTDTELVLEWASRLLDLHKTRFGLLSTHYAGSDCTDHVQYPIQKLMYNNCNLKMVFGGHVVGCGGERTIQVVNKCGENSYVFVSNYQDRKRGGNGWLRYYTFPRNDENRMCVYTFSPYEKKFELDQNSYFSLNLTNMTIIPDGCNLHDNPRPCHSHYASPGFVLASVWIASAIILFVYFLILTYPELPPELK